MSTGILKVQGDKVVDGDGKPIILRGAGLGGWMNMENFITGYPGQESQHRTSMLKVLGQEKYEFFFDKLLDYFFTEADAEFFSKDLGLNCLRIPFNYHHFEDDMNPRVLKENNGFKYLDRIVEICSKYEIYVILDLHAVPGGQNPDWHSDNVTNHAAFWEHKDFQDRVVWLWEIIAERYKNENFVAGYNLINEPCDPLHYRLVRFYERIEKAVRKVDGEHILWLDGNTFSMEFKYFEELSLENVVYGLHDYAMMGFPKGDRYEGSQEQDEKLESQFLRKAEFMRSIRGPIWNGEWGPVYADSKLDEDAEDVNQARYNLLAKQMDIYDKYGVHWNIWLYKDIGLQGICYLDPESKYMKTIAPFLERKRLLQLDAWGRRPSKEVEDVINPLVEFIDKHIPQSKAQYPTPWATERQIVRLVNQLWMAGCLSDEFAEQFKDMSFEELEQCAKSFSFEECVKREGLCKAMRANAEAVIGGEARGHDDTNGSALKQVELELD
ncbi:Beta-xylosidase [Pseudocercospora fuligena]|uniref:Beta-xylosidase n=1 Tax=Pseudocercospora fuligena TaxID=685502 RepID=A0A8H6VS42_9PEZI|nr:Beta-xylosidase [Pseudocercospora fuligena]